MAGFPFVAVSSVPGTDSTVGLRKNSLSFVTRESDVEFEGEVEVELRLYSWAVGAAWLRTAPSTAVAANA